MPGTDTWDDDLRGHFNGERFPLAEAIMAWFAAGGVENGRYLAQALIAPNWVMQSHCHRHLTSRWLGKYR